MQINGKRTKFIELAEARTSRAVKAISLIGNLGNRQNYEYDEDDAAQIINALHDAVAAVEAKMTAQDNKPQMSFKLGRQ